MGVPSRQTATSKSKPNLSELSLVNATVTKPLKNHGRSSRNGRLSFFGKFLFNPFIFTMWQASAQWAFVWAGPRDMTKRPPALQASLVVHVATLCCLQLFMGTSSRTQGVLTNAANRSINISGGSNSFNVGRS